MTTEEHSDRPDRRAKKYRTHGERKEKKSSKRKPSLHSKNSSETGARSPRGLTRRLHGILGLLLFGVAVQPMAFYYFMPCNIETTTTSSKYGHKDLFRSRSGFTPNAGYKGEHFQIGFDDQHNPLAPVMIVGGSDGSGTRAIVETLRQLGTIIISEDKESFDVHAGEIDRGWPGLIERIFLHLGRRGFFSTTKQLQSTGNNNYDNSTNHSHRMTTTSDNSSASSPTTLNSFKANFEWPPKQSDDSEHNKYVKWVESDVRKLMNSWNKKYHFRKQIQKNRQKARTKTRVPLFGKTLFLGAQAHDVTYAIKAPISMLALPVFASSYMSFLRQGKSAAPVEPLRPLKFLHVIRDGRDVALSNNQSPVIKFYNLTYPKGNPNHESVHSKFSVSSILPASQLPDRLHAKAIQLWNDWNIVVHRWAISSSSSPALTNTANHETKTENRNVVDGTDVPLVDYMWVRSEDLLEPGSQQRLETLKALAKFVGSSLSPEELCCISRQGFKDHGRSAHFEERESSNLHRVQPHEKGRLSFHSHRGTPRFNIRNQRIVLDRDDREGSNTDNNTKSIPHHPKDAFEHAMVQKRYGKWQTFLENKTDLLHFFHREGAEGLELFGYNPYRRVNYAEQVGGVPTEWANRRGSSKNNLENIPNDTISHDYDDTEDKMEGEEFSPGICEVSLACPN